MNTQAALLAIFTAGVSVATVSVAYFQWCTAHQKAALEALPKRYEIYEKLRSIVSNYLTTGEFTPEKHVNFVEMQNQARFYFGKEVSDYLEAARLELIGGDFFNRYGDRRNLDINDQPARNDRIAKFYNELDQLFIPYMRIDQKMPLWWWSRLKRVGQRLRRSTVR